jgi:uncharacterized membrane protein YqhA
MDRIGELMIKKLFEGLIWRSRFIVILAVIFGLLGAIVLFIIASLDIYNISVYTITALLTNAHPTKLHENLVSTIIGGIDLYLIAVVLFIFAFGLYELFISEIDEAVNDKKTSKILEIHSLDQLKDKIAKVIIMVLVVSFFQRVLHTEYNGAKEMLYFALSILALALGLYFLHRNSKY